MAKNERVKVELRGRVRMLSPRALEIATKHFGAKRQSVSAREVPVELLVIPPKAEIIKPKTLEEVKVKADEIVTKTASPEIPAETPAEAVIIKAPKAKKTYKAKKK